MSRSGEGYADLRDYAALGDGRTVALVALDGSIDWMPFPSLDSPPVFARLLDAERGGALTLRPVEPFSSERRYLPGTNVLETTFTTPSGEVVLTDALVTGVAGRLPWAELARRVDGVAGSVEMRWQVRPGDAFGDDDVRKRMTAHGPVLTAGDLNLILVGSGHGPAEDGEAEAGEDAAFAGAFRTEEGSRHVIVVCGTHDEPVHLPDPLVVDAGIDRTIESWQAWSRVFTYDGPWSDAVQRSALALKLLIFSPTGAIAAAATTGLPENPAGGKNYDYRFAWLRDLAYTVGALVHFGLREETHAAVAWALDTLKRHGEEMPIFFNLDGTLPDPVKREEAVGWRGIAPVESGNPAGGQLQLGVYADVIGIMRQYVDAGNILDERTAELLCGFADHACRMWPKKDSGMWELPRRRHYLSSKIGCWRALDDACHLAEIGQLQPSEVGLSLWKKNRGLLEKWIDEKGWSKKRQAYVTHPGSKALDAAILIHAGADFGPRKRMVDTIEAIRDELSVGPLVYRYSGVEKEESTFVACAFWLAQAMAVTGSPDEAAVLVDSLVALGNDVGLYSEMIDAADLQFWGNLPQALSHLALINAVTAINRARDEASD